MPTPTTSVSTSARIRVRASRLAPLPTTPRKFRAAELRAALAALKAVVRFLKRLRASEEVLKALDTAICSLEKDLRNLR